MGVEVISSVDFKGICAWNDTTSPVLDGQLKGTSQFGKSRSAFLSTHELPPATDMIYRDIAGERQIAIRMPGISPPMRTAYPNLAR